MERWDSSCSKWQTGHLVLTRAGHLHFFAPGSAVAKAAAASGMGGSSGAGAEAPAGGGGGGGDGAGSASWGGASSWAPPLDSLNLARCSFEQGAPRRVLACGAVRGLGRRPAGWYTSRRSDGLRSNPRICSPLSCCRRGARVSAV